MAVNGVLRLFVFIAAGACESVLPRPAQTRLLSEPPTPSLNPQKSFAPCRAKQLTANLCALSIHI